MDGAVVQDDDAAFGVIAGGTFGRIVAGVYGEVSCFDLSGDQFDGDRILSVFHKGEGDGDIGGGPVVGGICVVYHPANGGAYGKAAVFRV